MYIKGTGSIFGRSDVSGKVEYLDDGQLIIHLVLPGCKCGIHTSAEELRKIATISDQQSKKNPEWHELVDFERT